MRGLILLETVMLIPGVPLEVTVKYGDGRVVVYTTVASIPEAAIRVKVQKIIDSPLRVSKITVPG